MKYFLTFILFSLSYSVFSQEIEVLNNHFYINGEKISNKELAYKFKNSDYTAYSNFKAYKNKSAFGGFLLGFGGGLILADAIVGVSTWTTYPSALTYVGAATAVASIPVLTGRKKKLNKAIKAYNDAISNNVTQNDYEINFISNSKGIGLQIGI
jgi:hypothetical protein